MLCQKLTIRPSGKDDIPAIRLVEENAYGRKLEARLAERLILSQAEKTISLVAVCDGTIIGHVLMTAIDAPIKAMALSPLAVLPAYREMQVGSELVRSAIEAAKKAGQEVLFVRGDNGFYERFGFSSRLARPFSTKWRGRDFMALELKAGVLEGRSGKLAYPET